MQDQNESSRVNVNEVDEYAKAIVLGVADALINLTDQIAHPIDNIVLPVTDFIHDATVIIAKHSPPNTNVVITVLQNLLDRNPGIYVASLQRMQRKINNLKATGQYLIDAPGPEKVRAITSLGATIWIPGKLFSTSTAIIKNIKSFNMPLPRRFHTAPDEWMKLGPIDRLSLQEVRAIKGEDQLMYVVNHNRELIITTQNYDHWHLGGGKHAYAAGDIHIADGKIIRIDNRSGSYEPKGNYLQKLVEKTFERNGFTDAKGKWVDFQAEIAHLPRLHTQNKPGVVTRIPPASLNGMVFGFYLGLNTPTNNSPQTASPLGYNLQSKQQTYRSLTTLMTNHLHYHSLNSFYPRAYQPYGTNSIWSFSYPYYLQPAWHQSKYPNNNSISYTLNVRNSVYNAIRSEMSSLTPNLYSAYMKANLSLGLGYNISFSEFRSLASMTSLIGSYNSFNPLAKLSDVLKFCGEIGGVASQVGIIKDLPNSETHATADEYILCLPTDDISFPIEKIQQIAFEQAKAFLIHKTAPFISIHFNNDGYLYTVPHPAYQNTDILKMVTLLDYWMKCFLNGGIYDEHFIEHWHESCNTDEIYLRSMLIDLKKDCKKLFGDNASYFSLREFIVNQGANEQHGNTRSPYNQPMMVSYRLVFFLDKVERNDNILIPHVNFRVEYDIEEMPDYKEYLENHLKKHGSYPKEYLHLRRCYEQFANEVKEKLPKLSFCRPLFKLLEVTTSLCYLYPTLQKMGKAPVLKFEKPKVTFNSPKALPPIPVRYYRTYPLKLTMGETLGAITKQIGKEKFNAMFTYIFNVNHNQKLQQAIIDTTKEAVSTIIKERMTSQLTTNENFELNEVELEKIINLTCLLLKNNLNQLRLAIKRITKNLAKEFNDLPENFEEMSVAERLTLLAENIKSKLSNLGEKQLEINNLIKKDLQDINNLINGQEKVKIHYEQQIEIGKQEILKIEQHRDSEVAKVPGHLRAINQGAIDKFVKEQNQFIENIKTELNEFQEHLGKSTELLDKAKQLDTEIKSSLERLEHHSSNEKKDELEKNSSQKDEKLTALKIMIVAQQQLKKILKDIDRFQYDINFACERLLSIEYFANKIICQQYTHTVLGFTNNDLAKQAGDNFKIIGGCSVSLPDIESISIQNDLFKKEVSKIPNLQQTKLDGRTYTLFRIPVIDLVAEQANDYQSLLSDKAAVKEEVEFELQETFETGELPQISLENPVDDSGATVTHYAAAILNEDSFSKLTAKNPQQLELRDNLGHYPIHVAAAEGNSEVIINILKARSQQVDAKSNSGATPLILAIQHGHLQVVQVLCQSGANVNYRLPNGLFPLFLAIQNNFSEIALWMIEKLPNLFLSKKVDSGVTPLHLSMDLRLEKVAERLIEKGADLNLRRKSDGHTPLHTGAKMGYLKLLQAMVARGATLTTLLESQKSALHIAASSGHLEIVEYLISQNLAVDAKSSEGDTPLMLAILAGHLDVADCLAKHSKIDIVNSRGQTASLLAVQYNMQTVADTLILRGEKPDIKDQHGFDLIYYLVRNGEYQRFNALKETHSIDANQLYDGNSLLAIAAQYGHFMFVNDFLEESSVHFVSKKNHKQLIHYAVLAGEIGFVRSWLKDHEYEEGVLDKKSLAYLAGEHASESVFHFFLTTMTPKQILAENLMLAVIHSRNLALIDKVLQRWPSINTPIDDQGNSGLHIAVSLGLHHAIDLFLRRGADLMQKNKFNQTVFHIAVNQDDNETKNKLFSIVPEEKRPNYLKKNINEKFGQRSNESTPLNRQDLKLFNILKGLIKDEEFELAANFVVKNSKWLKSLPVYFINKLFLKLFNHIYDFDSKEEQKDLEFTYSKPDFLLLELANNNICPPANQGENSIMMAILRPMTEKEACYRLTLLVKYFSESLPGLLNDPLTRNLNFAQLAIKKNRLELFDQLDALCQKYSQMVSPQFVLHEAVLSDNYELVKILLKRYSVNLLNNKRQTATMLAAKRNNVQIIELLLNNGASLDSADINGATVLHYAVKHKSEQAALLLLPLLRKPNIADRKGITPLMHASAQGLLSVVQALCEGGDYTSDVDQEGNTALHFATARGQVPVIEHLIKIGFLIDSSQAPFSEEESEKCLQLTPLHLAAHAGQARAVSKLIELGADICKKDKLGQTVIEHAVKSTDHDTQRIIQSLPQYHQKEYKAGLLHSAAQSNNTDVLNSLVVEGVSLNILNQYGQSALHQAALYNASQAVQILLNSDEVLVDLADSDGNTPLHDAALRGNVTVIHLLLQNGADANRKNKRGETPLFIAEKLKHRGAVIEFQKGLVTYGFFSSGKENNDFNGKKHNHTPKSNLS